QSNGGVSLVAIARLQVKCAVAVLLQTAQAADQAVERGIALARDRQDKRPIDVDGSESQAADRRVDGAGGINCDWPGKGVRAAHIEQGAKKQPAFTIQVNRLGGDVVDAAGEGQSSPSVDGGLCVGRA